MGDGLPDSQPQHSGFHCWEKGGVALHHSKHLHPGPLPRQASFLSSSGTKRHQAGTVPFCVSSGLGGDGGDGAGLSPAQPQHSGFHSWDHEGVALHQSEHLHPGPLPRHASLLKSLGTNWHHAGTVLFPAPVRFGGTGVGLLPSQAQHSGFHCWEICGVALHQSEQEQPALLPRQAALWYSPGTNWHQAGTVPLP